MPRPASVLRRHARDVDRDRHYVTRGMKLGSGLADADAPVRSLSAPGRAPKAGSPRSESRST